MKFLALSVVGVLLVAVVTAAPRRRRDAEEVKSEEVKAEIEHVAVPQVPQETPQPTENVAEVQPSVQPIAGE